MKITPPTLFIKNDITELAVFPIDSLFIEESIKSTMNKIEKIEEIIPKIK